jgi:hypothetical protein
LYANIVSMALANRSGVKLLDDEIAADEGAAAIIIIFMEDPDERLDRDVANEEFTDRLACGCCCCCPRYQPALGAVGMLTLLVLLLLNEGNVDGVRPPVGDEADNDRGVGMPLPADKDRCLFIMLVLLLLLLLLIPPGLLPRLL